MAEKLLTGVVLLLVVFFTYMVSLYAYYNWEERGEVLYLLLCVVGIGVGLTATLLTLIKDTEPEFG